jgi:hypothetical protein
VLLTLTTRTGRACASHAPRPRRPRRGGGTRAAAAGAGVAPGDDPGGPTPLTWTPRCAPRRPATRRLLRALPPPAAAPAAVRDGAGRRGGRGRHRGDLAARPRGRAGASSATSTGSAAG